MHAVAGEPFDLAVVNDDGVLFGTVFLRIVEEDATNRFLRAPPPSGSRRAVLLDRLGAVIAAAAMIGLTTSDAVGSFVLLARLALGG